MFWGAKSFNQSIGGWRVDNVTDMSEMFYYARRFNSMAHSERLQKTANIFTWSALPETKDKVPRNRAALSRRFLFASESRPPSSPRGSTIGQHHEVRMKRG